MGVVCAVHGRALAGGCGTRVTGSVAAGIKGRLGRAGAVVGADLVGGAYQLRQWATLSRPEPCVVSRRLGTVVSPVLDMALSSSRLGLDVPCE